LNKELLKLNAVKTEFTAMVSHELKTPLTAISEGVSLVLDGSSGEISDKQKFFLCTAKRNIERLSRLVNDVLDMEKLDSGRMDFFPAENDINSVVTEAVDDISDTAKNRGIILEKNIDRNIKKITFDKDKITQVVANLLSNAMRYTSAGKISAGTSLERDGVVVTVKDTGTGIREEDLPKLFKSFTQIEKGNDRKLGSSGLGLAICKKIVHGHGGTIWVESEFGKGSSFSFVLPTRVKNRILLVVPEMTVLKTCEAFLKNKGFEVRSFVRGSDALESLKSCSSDLIIVDFDLWDMNPRDFANEVRGGGDQSLTPLLAVVSHGKSGERIGDYGQDISTAWIMKPFDLSELYYKVEELLKTGFVKE